MDKDKQYRRFYVEWWNIKKSTVYSGVGLIVFLTVLTLGGWILWRNNFFLSATDAQEIPKDAALVISFEGDVRITRASTRETILVTRTTYVSAGDTIQTQVDGKAQIQMIDGSILTIRPNSTVVIRDSFSIFGGTNVRVTLDGGQINVKTQEQESENVVEVKETENRLNPETEASFDINPKSGGGEIRVSRGSVETNTGIERAVITNGEFASVNNGKISPKESILAAPKLIAPQNVEQIPASSDISFRWQKPETASAVAYHLQVTRSPFFAADASILERENLTNQIFTMSNLPPGIYYWRIRASADSGQTSDWSEPFKFTVIKQTNGAAITASEWQVESIGGNIYRISGRTQPGATVRVPGRETFALADGTFLLQVSSSSANATVEISDERGNRSRYLLSLKTGRASRQ